MRLIAIDLGPSAVRKGESDRFKQTVREKLAAVRKDEKLMSPLLTTLGVTILYVPPENADLIDLDNLARRVIPFVHEELHPPATLQHVAKAYEKAMKSTTDWAKQIQTELKSLNRLPQYQVSRYQVFELPRSTADPKDGQVQMILHGGMASFGPWHKADEIIEAWQRAIRD